MQQVKTWGAMARRLMAFNLFTFLAVGLAFGQTRQVMQANIPYEFTFGSKVLPAGSYTLSVADVWFQMKSATGEVSRTLIITQINGPNEFFRDGSLVFDKTGGGHILSEVWLPGTDGILLHSTPKNHSRDVILFTSLNQNSNVSGRAAYNLTCSSCHGPTGNGDERADKFFNIKIPRLSSAEVQGKSDAAFREIIIKGTSVMPPVEIDESGFRHGLPPQDADAVIAYVRTLKR